MKKENRLIFEVPKGRDRLKWMGPAIIWMISAIATGELIFTPRIASIYGYTVLWTMVLAIFLKTLLAIEIGRYAVVTGSSFLEGIKTLPGPQNWGVWLIIVPQFFVAVTTIVGMSGAASSAIILAVPGGFQFWAVIFLLISIILVFFGKYRAVELISIVMALVITGALVTAALLIFPGIGTLATGLIPSLPPDVNFSELLPWIGFMMSGAAGLIWYSYWLVTRGYGAAYYRFKEAGEAPIIESDKTELTGDEREFEVIEETEPLDISNITVKEKKQLHGWINIMKISTIVAASIVLILLISLMILGAQLLGPLGLVPEGPAVTAVLSELLGGIWGLSGAALMIIAAFFAFWSSIVANLDGWTRMLGQGSIMILSQFKSTGKYLSMRFYRYLYLFGLMGILPIIFIIIRPEPVEFLIIAGIIEAIHIPVVAFSVLYLNWKTLPFDFRPSKLVTILTAAVGLFFMSFAAYYIYIELLGL
ncbi:MAG: Nramp family divalent metal transporter [Methanobacterium sp.]